MSLNPEAQVGQQAARYTDAAHSYGGSSLRAVRKRRPNGRRWQSSAQAAPRGGGHGGGGGGGGGGGRRGDTHAHTHTSIQAWKSRRRAKKASLGSTGTETPLSPLTDSLTPPSGWPKSNLGHRRPARFLRCNSRRSSRASLASVSVPSHHHFSASAWQQEAFDAFASNCSHCSRKWTAGYKYLYRYVMETMRDR